MKFVHLSDVKLGAPNQENPFGIDFEKERNEDFLAAVRYCAENEIEALFITGNLFYANPTEEALALLDETFLSAPKTRVFILTGTSDAGSEGSAYETHEWKSNTTVFSGDCIQRVYVQKYGLEVTGIGYRKDTWDKLDLQKLPCGRKGRTQVLLLPFLKDEAVLRESGYHFPYDYVAVGGNTVVLGEDYERVYAPGAFSPEGFSAQLKHGFLSVTSEKEGKAPASNTAEFIPGKSREFISLKINVGGKASYEEVEAEAKKNIEKYGEQHIYKLTITGEVSPSLFLSKDRLYALGHIAGVTDETDRVAALQRIKDAHGDDALSRFISDMEFGQDQEIRRKALSYGMNALLAAQGKE